MNAKREIHGLDQAVVLLMFALDRVFAHRVLGWRRARKGFRVEVIPHLNTPENELYVAIYSVGLPKDDMVSCRFIRFQDHWCSYEAHISIRHSASEIAGFNLKTELTTNDQAHALEHVIRSADNEEKFKEIISRDAIYRCESAS